MELGVISTEKGKRGCKANKRALRILRSTYPLLRCSTVFSNKLVDTQMLVRGDSRSPCVHCMVQGT